MSPAGNKAAKSCASDTCEVAVTDPSSAAASASKSNDRGSVATGAELDAVEAMLSSPSKKPTSAARFATRNIENKGPSQKSMFMRSRERAETVFARMADERKRRVHLRRHADLLYTGFGMYFACAMSFAANRWLKLVYGTTENKWGQLVEAAYTKRREAGESRTWTCAAYEGTSFVETDLPCYYASEEQIVLMLLIAFLGCLACCSIDPRHCCFYVHWSCSVYFANRWVLGDLESIFTKKFTVRRLRRLPEAALPPLR